MKTLRTPDERFVDLPGYRFEPNYAEIPDGDAEEPGGTLRVHYLDEGPHDAAPILLMHGEPSWSYLYRKMIPLLVEAGHRVIAPDLVGFGRSDKPTEMTDYTYARHVAWMKALLIDHLDLTDTTFFGQDWGGLVGLRVVTADPGRFARIVIGNTGLPTGERNPGKAFMAWQKFSQTSPTFDIGVLINAATITDLSPDEIAAYDAPFPDDSYKAGARIFPSLVPTTVDDPESPANIEAWKVLEQWDKPFICCFSDSDPITAGGEAAFLGRVPGADGQPHVTTMNAHHFFQEDAADQLAQVLIDAIAPDDPAPPDGTGATMSTSAPRYGQIDRDYAMRLATTAPDEDGPVWMVNLMKYRETAQYADGRESTISGLEADDEYAPTDVLRAIGATPVFFGTVDQQLLGDAPRWDRIGVVRYATRRSFIDMQSRPDFQKSHEHKDAGMEQTIVMGCLPMPHPTVPAGVAQVEWVDAPHPPTAADGPVTVLHVIRFVDAEAAHVIPEEMQAYTSAAAVAASRHGVRVSGWFSVEGTIVGDGRVWHQARFNAFPSKRAFMAVVTDPARLAAQQEHRDRAIADTYTMIVRPTIDRLHQSVVQQSIVD